jgi:hypothetical protein
LIEVVPKAPKVDWSKIVTKALKASKAPKVDWSKVDWSKVD